MRVLHFNKTYLPNQMGGIEQTIKQMALGMTKLGIETEILTLTAEKNPSTICLDGYMVHSVKQNFRFASTGFSISAFSRFAELAQKADIIHYHFPWPFMDIVHFLTMTKKPSVVTYHSDVIRQKVLLRLYRPLMLRFLDDVNCIVATSPNYLESSDVLKIFRHRVKIVPIGLDKATYPEPSCERQEHWLRQLGPKFFLFVGFLRYYKGLHILVEAAHDTGFPVAILGTGPVEPELRAKVRKYGCNNVHFLGWLPDDDKVALLSKCYGLILPSHVRAEAFGISLLEGAMFEKPLISCEIGTGTSFINVDNKTGMVVTPGNSRALSDAMRHLWDNPDVAFSMGKQAQKRFWKHFRADQMVAAYSTLYKAIVSRFPHV